MSEHVDSCVLGAWHDGELVLARRSKLEWYAAMHRAAAVTGTWAQFLARVAAVDPSEAQLLQDTYEPDLDEVYQPIPSNWDGLNWPGLPTDAEPPIGATTALGELLRHAGGPGGADYRYVHESDADEAIAVLTAAGLAAERDDVLVGSAFARDDW